MGFNGAKNIPKSNSTFMHFKYIKTEQVKMYKICKNSAFDPVLSVNYGRNRFIKLIPDHIQRRKLLGPGDIFFCGKF
jgi:hypothetical protein